MMPSLFLGVNTVFTTWESHASTRMRRLDRSTGYHDLIKSQRETTLALCFFFIFNGS